MRVDVFYRSENASSIYFAKQFLIFFVPDYIN